MTSNDNTRTITKNSFWYTVEGSATTLVMLLASVPVARVMGPDILGRYIFLVFVTGIAQRVANVGIPATTCKYMAEALGQGHGDLARAIFRATMRVQAVVAAAVTLIAVGIVYFFDHSPSRLVAYLIVASIFPGMVNNIPAQANLAAENFGANLPASFANFASYSLLVVLTLWYGWGLVGLATATLVSRVIETAVRYIGVQRWLRAYRIGAIPQDLRTRMFTFSRQNLVVLLLSIIVWDRSELLFLNHFSPTTQLAFYSLAFSVIKQLLMVPLAFSSAIGVTILAQYGRDARELKGLIYNGTRYVTLLSIPLFIGVAAVSHPLILMVYGHVYADVIPVLALMSVLAIPRAFQVFSEHLLQATETQAFMVRWLTLSAVANLLFDWLLIPRYGAIGAAIANGVGQTLAVVGVWAKATSILNVQPPTRFMTRVFAAGAVMFAAVWPISYWVRPVIALALGIPLGAATFFVCIRLMRCLETTDLVRLQQLTARLPGRLRTMVDAALVFMTGAAATRHEPTVEAVSTFRT